MFFLVFPFLFESSTDRLVNGIMISNAASCRYKEAPRNHRCGDKKIPDSDSRNLVQCSPGWKADGEITFSERKHAQNACHTFFSIHVRTNAKCGERMRKWEAASTFYHLKVLIGSAARRAARRGRFVKLCVIPRASKLSSVARVEISFARTAGVVWAAVRAAGDLN